MSLERREGAEHGWRRSTVPVTTFGMALLLAVMLLPSAFTNPQSEPSVTLEFAPVPPDDEDPPPPDNANISTLGISESVTAPGSDGDGDGGAGPGLPPPPPVEGTGDRPVTKRCVGSPPRQTEDPMSPPCVAHFEGDNFGSTYRGVDANEIRVLIYMEGGPCSTGPHDNPWDCAPIDTTFDLAKPPPEEREHIDLQLLRALQHYFNDRYQTYGRFVRFLAHYDAQPNENTPEERRADAAELIAEWDPFAVISRARGNEVAFMEAMAAEGVMVFGSGQQRFEGFYQDRAPQIWSFLPSVEQQARSYVNHLCRQVVPYPVSISGNPGENGQPRRLGLIWADDPSRPGYGRFAEIVKAGVEACGGEFVAEATYPVVGTNQARDGQTNDGIAEENIARMRAAGVTTIIWPQGYEVWHTRAAATAAYYPEWFKAGDRQLEGQTPADFQDKVVYEGHVIVATTFPFSPVIEEDPCYWAYSEGNPRMHPADRGFGCQIRPWHEHLRQLFIGIQVAGPKLTPQKMEEGFRAIPAIATPDVRVPACFYPLGDFTCVKDAMLVWWGSGHPDNPSGCFRVMRGGQRYLASDWPEEDVVGMRDPDQDACLLTNASING